MDVWVVDMIEDDSAARPDEAEGIKDFLFFSSPLSATMTLISSVDGGGVLAAAFLLLPFPGQQRWRRLGGGMLGDSRFRFGHLGEDSLEEKNHSTCSTLLHNNMVYRTAPNKHLYTADTLCIVQYDC